MAKIQRIYKDLDLSFAALPGTGDVARKYDVNAVRQALKILILSAQGERKFNYKLGSPIYKMLFDPISIFVANMIERELDILISNNEPRVTDKRIIVDPDIDNNAYNITIEFRVRGIADPVVYSTFLKRLR